MVKERIEAINIEVEVIPERKETDFKDALHWQLTLNGKVKIKYSEGIGHFFNTNHCLYNKVVAQPLINGITKRGSYALAFSASGITVTDYKGLCTKRIRIKADSNQYLKTLEVTPPDIKDIIYSLTMDAVAVDYTFEEWCVDYGCDVDSRKAYKTYQDCKDSFTRVRQLGFTLAELQEYFQDY
jgi:hypothetical protein